ncbi:hypothetical protein E2C01_060174 [Portunus trituberculatus]|uniref:Uncharacterized protein n=1 Tax=Portunus trituberculatus TaxID=210409 RepID=A0A5B7H099_PORTR|nr:hypothetical protein [Portunus trituberculatus]
MNSHHRPSSPTHPRTTRPRSVCVKRPRGRDLEDRGARRACCPSLINFAILDSSRDSAIIHVQGPRFVTGAARGAGRVRTTR